MKDIVDLNQKETIIEFWARIFIFSFLISWIVGFGLKPVTKSYPLFFNEIKQIVVTYGRT